MITSKFAKQWLGIVLYFASLFPVWGQSSRLFTSDHGLSNSQINQVYQDRRGFIWIATEDGLNHFDGNRFTIFRHVPDDSTSLASNFVHTVFEDSRGNFWIGTINGLQLYSYTTNSFRKFPLSLSNDTSAYPHVTALLEDSKGSLWVCTSGNGIVKINPNDLTYAKDKTLSSQLISIYLQTIYEDRNGKIWLGSEDKGLIVYDPSTGSVDQSFYRHDWIKWLSDKQISDICEDANGNVIIGSLNGGLGIYYRDENRFEIFNQKGVIPVKTLLNDGTGTIWVGTDGQGIKQLINGQLMNFDVSGSQLTLNKTKAHSLLKDNQGNIWAGIFHKGVLMLPRYSNKFEYFGYAHNPDHSIGNGCIMSIAATPDGRIWTGTDGNGLYSIDPLTRTTRQYSKDLGSLHGNTVMTLTYASGLLWVGTYLNGLASINPSNGKMERVTLSQDVENDKIITITSDRHNMLWIGTYGRGVLRYDPATRKVSSINSFGSDTLNRLTNNWVNALRFDAAGKLWIGTFKGVDCFDPATGRFLHFNVDNGFLSDNVVYCLLHDKKGKVWVGTSNGLACIDPEANQSVIYFTKNGLSGNVINGMEEDSNGNIWISTNSGLSRYSPTLGVFTNYYSFEGLQSNEFRRGAAFKAVDGKLYFGGINGITTFYPQNIGVARPLPDLYFTDFRIFNQSVAVGDHSGNVTILDRSLLEKPEVRLRHTDNMFSIEFIALEYTNPEKIEYRYMMEGFEHNWKSTGVNNRMITYTNLPPGNYTFKVAATDNLGKEKQIALSILILPPWWMTWWAIIIYFVVASGLTLLIIREIHSRLRQNHQLLELQYAEQANDSRLQLFANISHEIRTPLTLIINPLEQLMDKESDNTKRAIYALMHRNSLRILRLMNQLIDVRKIDKGQMQLQYEQADMVPFIKDIINAFEYAAQSRQIEVTFVTKLNELGVWIDRSNFDKVLFNLMSNALKFTPKMGRVQIRLSLSADQKQYIIEVEDNGIGIPDAIREKIFDRFYQGKTAMFSKGSGMGLHLARRLVEMHHGTIQAFNAAEQGALFVITMPLGNAHIGADEYAVESQVDDEIHLTNTVILNQNEDQPVASEQSKGKGKTKVLVAEDDPDVRTFIINELSPQYRVIDADNGKSAWILAIREIPDIVISDVVMPEMTGLELCKKLKIHPDTAHIPVVLLSALAKDEDVVEGLDHGADVYISKPFNIEVLKSNISRLLQSRQMLKMKFTNDKVLDLDRMKLDSSDEKLLNKVIKAIQSQIQNSDLSVEMISQQIGISRVHLHRKLKELTGQAPRDFIKTIRLKQASQLLMNNDANVSEIAFSVGFSSHSYFTNCFRDYFGLSPSEFAEKHKDDKSN
jgi:signal transduction histidine kinase/ligand-binding sensor domain-containing protein/DNA-binding response OmpR family regulator